MTGMARRKKRQQGPLTAGRIIEATREIERTSDTGATGFTLLKFCASPIARLIDTKQIGPDELQAAHDITRAVLAVGAPLIVRSMSLERIDRSRTEIESAASLDAQRRYLDWARHWSVRSKQGDPTLQIVYSAVVDERPFYIIEQDLNIRHGRAKKATIRGLRDYAARAGWVRGFTASKWKAEAGQTFPLSQRLVSAAMWRARRT